MKIYDVSQEAFSSQIYANDPVPGKSCFVQWKKAICIT